MINAAAWGEAVDHVPLCGGVLLLRRRDQAARAHGGVEGREVRGAGAGFAHRACAAGTDNGVRPVVGVLFGHSFTQGRLDAHHLRSRPAAGPDPVVEPGLRNPASGMGSGCS